MKPNRSKAYNFLGKLGKLGELTVILYPLTHLAERSQVRIAWEGFLAEFSALPIN
ncbi:hypothetical protein [Lusitaniella coriacea]|uniref:hypothetical protein n=1 Tax=Lusitaniella coriacea TaxID=1983105 RepID=UPI003CE90E5C